MLVWKSIHWNVTSVFCLDELVRVVPSSTGISLTALLRQPTRDFRIRTFAYIWTERITTEAPHRFLCIDDVIRRYRSRILSHAVVRTLPHREVALIYLSPITSIGHVPPTQDHSTFLVSSGIFDFFVLRSVNERE